MQHGLGFFRQGPARFCNPPAQLRQRTGPWKAGQRRRWKETVSTGALRPRYMAVEGTWVSKVDCRNESQDAATKPHPLERASILGSHYLLPPPKPPPLKPPPPPKDEPPPRPRALPAFSAATAALELVMAAERILVWSRSWCVVG